MCGGTDEAGADDMTSSLSLCSGGGCILVLIVSHVRMSLERERACHCLVVFIWDEVTGATALPCCSSLCSEGMWRDAARVGCCRCVGGVDERRSSSSLLVKLELQLTKSSYKSV